MKNRLLTTLIAGSALLLLVLACEERPLPSLTYRQRELADTVYLERIGVLRPQLDSLCDARFDSLVQVAVDSLIRVRRTEEARLRARVRQQLQSQ